MELLKYIAIVITMILCVWGLGFLVSNSMSGYEIIYPEKNVRCIVVSRMFNTSVDCWITN